MQPVDMLVLSDMTFIDNRYSTIGNIGKDGDYLSVVLRNIKFYGETEASECPGKPGMCITEKDA